MEDEKEATTVLKDLYKDVSDWLKFAEAKNGALLTLNGVLLFGLLKIDTSGNLGFLSTSISLSSVILFINIAIILMSFLPALSQDTKTINIDFSDKNFISKNYLFYGNLNKINVDNFISLISKKYSVKINEKNNYVIDLSTQILSVSAIATKKYKFFYTCTYFTLLVFFIFLFNIFKHIF